MVVIDNIQVIQATLAPIFLVTGAAIFLNFVQARLFRVSDRICSPEASKQARVHDEIRLLLLRNAVILGVGVIALTILTTILLLVPSAFPGRSVRAWPIWTFGGGLVSFGLALAFAVWDAVLAVRSVRRESDAREAAEQRERAASRDEA